MWRSRLHVVKRFVSDSEALVTVQVVIFSVMLFSAIGMVIDFGRAYSAHSRMQAYIDQVALAAASELDGKNTFTDSGGNTVSDAVTRATSAANQVSKQALFTTAGGQFQIGQLRFLSSSPTDANGNFDASLISDASDPSLATHVLAIAQSASVRAALLDLNIGGGTTGNLAVGTFAVATSRQVTCQDMSTLVMCNPFENSSESFESVMSTGTGYRMRLTADINLGLNSNSTTIGLGQLKNPWSEIGTDSGACEVPSNIPGYSSSMTATELEQLRDACLLAVVDSGLSCVNDQVIVKAANPGSVTTGVDVRFDMFDGPMAEILDPAYPFYNQFYPDKAAVHGRITRTEYVTQLSERHELIHELSTDPAFFDAVADHMCTISCARGYDIVAVRSDLTTTLNTMVSQMAARVPGYDASVSNFDVSANVYPITPALNGSRQDHIRNGTEFHMIRFTCLDEGQDCNQFGVHGAITNQSSSPLEYATDYYTPLGPNLTQGTTTNYEFYSQIERNDLTFSPVVASSGIDAFDKDDGPQWALNEQYPQDTSLTQTEPVNYLNAHGMAVNALGSNERRRMRVGVVNCGSKETYASVTGNGDASFADSYFVDVVDVVDVFLTEAPVVHECSTPFTSANDPDDINPCSNDDITSMSLIAEYIEPVSDNMVSSQTRTYAVLVH